MPKDLQCLDIQCLDFEYRDIQTHVLETRLVSSPALFGWMAARLPPPLRLPRRSHHQEADQARLGCIGARNAKTNPSMVLHFWRSILQTKQRE